MAEGDLPTELMFVNFNQDASSLAVGSKNGYRLFAINNPDRLEVVHEEKKEDICIVERHFQSSLVALVSMSSPRKLKMCHFKRGQEITNQSYSNTILAVRLNRERLVVCLEDSLYIHNIRTMMLIHTIKKTPLNPKGLCALSPSSERSFLAYPGQQSSGAVQIFDTMSLENKLTITAHDSTLAAMVFNPKGDKLATASERGTVIRVFDVIKGQGLYEFRRGLARCVSIHSLCFSNDSLFLCASSDTETVHIFKLERPKDNESVSSQETSIPSLVSNFIEGVGNFLPLNSSVFNQLRSFAQAKLPCRNGLKNVCAITPEKSDRTPKVLVASCDGFLYIYDLDIKFGGECNLVRQHKLDAVTNEASDDVAYSSPGPVSYAAAVGRGPVTRIPPSPPSPLPSPSPATGVSPRISQEEEEFPPINARISSY